MSTSSKTGGWLFIFLLVLIIVPAVIYFRIPKPCREPITYRIGQVDERFGLSRQEFRTAVNKAAAMWGQLFSKRLFQEDPQGTIEVNLVYDYRQEATDRLKKLDYKIDRSRNSYEDLKIRLENLNLEFNQKKAVLDNNLNAHNTRVNIFNAEVESWNRRGGVPESIHQRLLNEKDELKVLGDTLQEGREEIKKMADTINSLVVVINEIASDYNLDLVDHQNTGKQLGSEFCEGFFENKDGRKQITIYQFDNENRLVRVLAHEFGHALGLNHSNNEEAVMYRLVSSNALELAADDVAALKKRCNSR